jgi:hypothetical protein
MLTLYRVQQHQNRILDELEVNVLLINPLTPELNPSAQRCLTRFLTGDFAS